MNTEALTISPERLDLLQRGWVRLLDAYGVTPADAYPVFDRLVAAYTEPHRYYHTLEHVAEVLRVAGRLPATDPKAVQLAVWFHDAVYDPRAKDNEDRSAALVPEWLGPLGVSAVVTARVADMVRATAHLSGDAVPNDTDTTALLDADLAILAASEERYRRYAADVRKEYAWVPDDAYRAGRTAVLEAFLRRPRLYRTEILHQEGDAPARRNLRAEIESLSWTLPRDQST
jgi:predicted metal-dependent HD superfamily phosphohydrolase